MDLAAAAPAAPAASLPALKPMAACLSPRGDVLYTANFGTDSVSVVDLTARRLLRTLPAGPSPAGIAIDPSGASLWVSNRFAATLTRVDIAAGTIAATVAVGAGPDAVVVAPSGEVWVSCSGSAEVWGIDPTNIRPPRAIAVGDRPMGLALGSGGARLFVANFGDQRVSIIDTVARAVVRTVPLTKAPYDVAADPAGADRFLVVYPYDQALAWIDGASGQVLGWAQTGQTPQALAVDPGTGAVYVSNHDGDSITVVERFAATVHRTLPSGGARPWAVLLR